MKITVAIPTYNSAKLVKVTLESIFAQTLQPDEILVADDGSTDETLEILKALAPRVTVLRRPHLGLAPVRNALVEHARGDIIAFIDSDDVWHPKYLETLKGMCERHPGASAYYLGHMNFTGLGGYVWESEPAITAASEEKIEAVDFLRRYNETNGAFASMSYMSVPAKVMRDIGPEPFACSGAEDSYFCNLMPLHGPVIYQPARLAAYRLVANSSSSSHLRLARPWANAFETLAPVYDKLEDSEMRKTFWGVYAMKLRRSARIMIGSGQIKPGRELLRKSVRAQAGFSSMLKSLVYLALSYLPVAGKSTWLPANRPEFVVKLDSAKKEAS